MGKDVKTVTADDVVRDSTGRLVIKGPGKISGKDLQNILAGVSKKMGSSVKMPFTATGWKSTKGMDLLPDSFKVKGSIENDKKEKEVVVEKKASKKNEPKKTPKEELDEFKKRLEQIAGGHIDGANK